MRRQPVRRVAAPDMRAGAVLGVDDRALRKGRAYGTIVVALRAHRPIDLLEGRSAIGVAVWLVEDDT